MIGNVAFVGGIHGVGKSTICRQICNELKLDYLSASDLINWKDIALDFQNKNVQNIPETQDRLIIGLTNTVQKDRLYILDGHYCLLNENNELINVPLETFKLINPFSLNIVLEEINKIRDRLEYRDKRPYDQELLTQMQDNELNHANYLSKTLGVTLNIITHNDFSGLTSSIHEFMEKHK